MSDANPELISDGSVGHGEQESGGQFERPKSRLPRLPQASKPVEFDGVETMAVKTAPKTPAQAEARISTHALSVRQYLEATVVPVLMKGLMNLVRERPEDPVEYLANYLKQNNPSRVAEDEPTS